MLTAIASRPFHGLYHPRLTFPSTKVLGYFQIVRFADDQRPLCEIPSILSILKKARDVFVSTRHFITAHLRVPCRCFRDSLHSQKAGVRRLHRSLSIPP